MHYPAKISVTSDAMEDELYQAFPTITRAWLEEVNKAKLQNPSANQLSVIKSFPINHGLEFPHVAQLLQIVLPSPANTPPVEHGHTFLEMVASKKTKPSEAGKFRNTFLAFSIESAC